MHPLTDTWWRLFVNWTDGSLRARGTTWIFDPRPLTRKELSDALGGTQSLGVYAVNLRGFSRWLCLDVDTTEAKAGLLALAEQMAPGTSLFEPSRRGGHLWRFCPPTPWQQVQAYGTWLMDQAGITCEVFPKGAGRTGVRLPLTVHPKTGDTYPVIDPRTGAILDHEELHRLHPASLPVVELRREVPTNVGLTREGNERQTDFEALFRAIAEVTRVRQYGSERAIGQCPFHDDQHPSLSVVGGFWRCWAGCGEGGVNAFRARLRTPR